MVVVSQGMSEENSGRDVRPICRHCPFAIFDTHTQRRYYEPVHQRYRHAAADDGPEHSADASLPSSRSLPCSVAMLTTQHLADAVCDRVSAFVMMLRLSSMLAAKSGSYFVSQQAIPRRCKRLHRRNDSTARRSSRSSATKTQTKVEFDKTKRRLVHRTLHEANKFRQYPRCRIMNTPRLLPLCAASPMLGGGLALAGVPNLTLTGMGGHDARRAIAVVPAAQPQLHHADQPDLPAGLVPSSWLLAGAGRIFSSAR